MTPCSMVECDRPVYSRGWCQRHYDRWYKHGSPVNPLRPTPAERFWTRVAVRGEDECWNWISTATKGNSVRGAEGRGVVRWRGRTSLAYRVAWELAHGEPPPDHLCVCHTCDNGRCCNPAHLFLGTKSDNMRDASRKGRVVNQFGPQRQSNYR